MNNELIDNLITEHLDPNFRGRLLDRGLSRSMIWKNGVLPDNSIQYSEDLTYELLSFGYSMLSLALKSSDGNGDENLRIQAFEKAAIALMTILNNGDENYSNRPFHTLLCASSYHLAHYSAKAYSLLKKYDQLVIGSILEQSLRLLLVRDLNKLSKNIPKWKLEIQQNLEDLTNTDTLDHDLDNISVHLSYLNIILVDRFLEVLYEFLEVLETGYEKHIDSIEKKLIENISISLEYDFLEEWWIYRITRYLLRDLWEQTYHKILPIDKGNTKWSSYRTKFIKNLLKKNNAEIDLWPSQIEGAKSAINDSENLVVSLPTSAGKTRIAELCILRTLSNDKKVIFITPLRALSVQTEITLMNTFSELGVGVSSLYGGLSLYGFEKNQFTESDILIGTPEKLDFVLKHDSDLLNDVGLIVLDEGHMLGANNREIKFEILIQNLLNRADSASRRIVCLSAILPSGEELGNFVNWISNEGSGKAISTNWRPTDLRFGQIYSNKNEPSYRLDFVIGDQKPFIPKFIDKVINPSKTSVFPNTAQDLCLSIAHKYIKDDQSILIYCPQKQSVIKLAKSVVELIRCGKLDFDPIQLDNPYYSSVITQGEELFGLNHPIIISLKQGIVIHHGSLPKDYRTAVELLLKHCRVKLIISSPTLAQGLNLQVNVILFFSIYRFGKCIPLSEFKNVIGRAGRSFIDLQGIVLFSNIDNNTKKRADWNNLVAGKDGLSLTSGLMQLVVNLIFRLVNSLNEKNVDKLYEYIINSSYQFEFPIVNSESNERSENENLIWKEQLNLLDYSIINIIGNNEVDQKEIPDYIDFLLKKSLFYSQLSRFNEESQNLIKKFVKKRAYYLWDITTHESRRQLYLSGVSLSTINNNDEIIEEILKKIKIIEFFLSEWEFDSEKLSSNLIQLVENIFKINEFSPKNKPKERERVLFNWLNGEKYLINDDIDLTVGFVESDISYNLIWAIEFLRARNNLCSTLNIENDTFDYISQVFEYGVINKNALFLLRLGFKSRAQAQKISKYLKFNTIGELVNWLNHTNLDIMSDFFDKELIELLKDLTRRLNSSDKIKVTRFLYALDINWLVSEPVDYVFTNTKLINIDGNSYIVSRTADIIGRLNYYVNIDLMSNIYIYINNDLTIDVKYDCFAEDVQIIENSK